MPISAGSRIGSYEVISLLGEGGMGKVYRARDTKLGRDVAIKILPDHSIGDADRRARFDREARLLASLNHPHIASIYGAEDTPDGVRALVLELVEGPTLADQLFKGPLPLTEALSIAAQIVEALDAAHERGIVHRDLKPANIKITADGQVKVLDFGLAKLATNETDETSESNFSNSPTVTGTRAGLLLGTAAYMSPEQARGLAVDKRTDIWAFGCVLYEMLTGRMAFRGETVTDILAAILERDVDWSALPDGTPPSLRRLLRRCLEKDRKRRLRDIADARVELDDIAASSMVPPLHRERRAGKPAGLTGAAVAGAVLGGLIVWTLRPITTAPSGVVTRLTLAPAEQLTDSGDPFGTPCSMGDCAQRSIAMSPDGRRVAYAAVRRGQQQLYLRDLNTGESTPIAGTEEAVSPTFSPDGRSIAFISQFKVKKVQLGGTSPQVLVDYASGSGLTWRTEDVILFSPGQASGIWRVPASGGTATPVTKVEGTEVSHRFPDLLPGGNGLLFSVDGGTSDDQIYVQSLSSGERRALVNGVAPHYLPTGHLVYVQEGTLFAVPFDLGRLETRGNPAAVIQGIRSVVGAPQVAFSDNGSMIYMLATDRSYESTLVWVDLAGNEQPTRASRPSLAQPRLTHDGSRVAISLRGGASDLWSFDFARETWSRLTFDSQSSFPLWEPDRVHLTYASGKNGPIAIFRKRPGGGDPEERILGSDRANFPLSWAPDGQTLAYVSVEPISGQDIWTFTPNAAQKNRPFLQTRFREGGPQFSPDGRWIAYGSDESGRNEIYVRPYPGSGDKWTISTDGGTEPVWARDSRQIFYRNGTAIMVADVRLAPTFNVGKPRRLFDKPYELSGAYWPNYDVTADGRRLLMVKTAEPETTPMSINIVLNWTEELKQRVPVP